MTKIKLYHYSDKNIIDKLSPSYFGNNHITGYSEKLSPLKRLYFYTSATQKENCFCASAFCYTATIDAEKIYDVRTDTEKYCISSKNFNEALQKIKSAGFKGCIGSNGFEVVILFYAIPITEKIEFKK